MVKSNNVQRESSKKYLKENNNQAILFNDI